MKVLLHKISFFFIPCTKEVTPKGHLQFCISSAAGRNKEMSTGLKEVTGRAHKASLWARLLASLGKKKKKKKKKDHSSCKNSLATISQTTLWICQSASEEMSYMNFSHLSIIDCTHVSLYPLITHVSCSCFWNYL